MPKRTTGLTQAIIENATAQNPRPWAEIAAIKGVKPNTVYVMVARLRKKGRIPAVPTSDGRSVAALNFRDARIARMGASVGDPILDTPPAKWDTATLEAIDKLPILTADQRKKLLSLIGMRPSTGVAQAAALGKLEEIDRGAGTQIGPPTPLTEQQQIDRLSRLMRAVGQLVAEKAMEAAFVISSTGENDPATEGESASGGESNVA